MRRFLVHEIPPHERQIIITGSEALHMTRVLRMKVGERVVVMDGEGRRCEALIESAGAGDVVVVLDRAIDAPPPSPVKIILCQALLKAQAMDDLVKKTSELGVTAIIPFHSARTVVKLEGERFERKRDHWERIIKSASKQSDRNRPAQIGTLRDFEGVCRQYADETALKVLLWERAGGLDMKDVLRNGPKSTTVVGVVGPEGGFAAHEAALAAELGFSPVSLGRRILRADTAAITFVSILQYEWGDLADHDI